MQKTENLNEFNPLTMIPLQNIINILESKRLSFIISFIALCFSDVKDNHFLILHSYNAFLFWKSFLKFFIEFIYKALLFFI